MRLCYRDTQLSMSLENVDNKKSFNSATCTSYIVHGSTSYGKHYTYICYRGTQLSMSLENVDTHIKKSFNSAICTLYMAQHLTVNICTFATMLPSFSAVNVVRKCRQSYKENL